MFFGSYEYTIDDKGRLVIPSKMRLESGPVLFAMRGFEHCLTLYTHATFANMVNQVNQHDFNQPQVRQFVRTALSSVIELALDDHGRVQIPLDTLRQFKLEKNVRIIGINDHIEIWNPHTWNEYQQKAASQYESLAENLAKK